MANKKISQLTAATTPLAGTELTAIVQSGVTKKVAVSEFGGASYQVYTALLTQSGTDAPVATVLENTLGGTVVWTRAGVGDYVGTLAGAFPLEKTTITAMSTYAITVGGNNEQNVPSDAVFIATKIFEGVAADGLLYYSAIEIRVYP